MNAKNTDGGLAVGEDHYLGEGASDYLAHHRKNLRTRLTTWREQTMLRRAMDDAGSVDMVLDLPCGTGRFWPVFEAAGTSSLIAGDASEGMLRISESAHRDLSLRVQRLHTSAFDIDVPDKSVDFIACMRFYHHLSMQNDRERVLAELKRVTRSHVAISLWVDGNLGSLRRLRRPPPTPDQGFGKRICRRAADVEPEFRASGFEIVQHYDVWPRISMWRVYLLRICDG